MLLVHSNKRTVKNYAFKLKLVNSLFTVGFCLICGEKHQIIGFYLLKLVKEYLTDDNAEVFKM